MMNKNPKLAIKWKGRVALKIKLVALESPKLTIDDQSVRFSKDTEYK